MLELDGQVMAHINITATKPFISSIVTGRFCTMSHALSISKRYVRVTNCLLLLTCIQPIFLAAYLLVLHTRNCHKASKKNREKQSSGD